MALAHQIGSQTERAYHRTRQLEKRSLLMESRGKYCCPDAPAELSGHSAAYGLPPGGAPATAEAP
jgi:hypothetical protein